MSFDISINSKDGWLKNSSIFSLLKAKGLHLFPFFPFIFFDRLNEVPEIIPSHFYIVLKKQLRLNNLDIIRTDQKAFSTNQTISIASFGVIIFKKGIYCH